MGEIEGREPDRRSDNPEEQQLAEALLVMRKAVNERKSELKANDAGNEEGES